MTWYAKLLAWGLLEVIGKALCWTSVLLVLFLCFQAWGQTTTYTTQYPQTYQQQQQQRQIDQLQQQLQRLEAQQRRGRHRERRRDWSRYHHERGLGRDPAFPYWNR